MATIEEQIRQRREQLQRIQREIEEQRFGSLPTRQLRQQTPQQQAIFRRQKAGFEQQKQLSLSQLQEEFIRQQQIERDFQQSQQQARQPTDFNVLRRIANKFGSFDEKYLRRNFGLSKEEASLVKEIKRESISQAEYLKQQEQPSLSPVIEDKPLFQGAVRPFESEVIFRETGKRQALFQGPVMPSESSFVFREKGIRIPKEQESQYYTNIPSDFEQQTSPAYFPQKDFKFLIRNPETNKVESLNILGGIQEGARRFTKFTGKGFESALIQYKDKLLPREKAFAEFLLKPSAVSSEDLAFSLVTAPLFATGSSAVSSYIKAGKRVFIDAQGNVVRVTNVGSSTDDFLNALEQSKFYKTKANEKTLEEVTRNLIGRATTQKEMIALKKLFEQFGRSDLYNSILSEFSTIPKSVTAVSNVGTGNIAGSTLPIPFLKTKPKQTTKQKQTPRSVQKQAEQPTQGTTQTPTVGFSSSSASAQSSAQVQAPRQQQPPININLTSQTTAQAQVPRLRLRQQQPPINISLTSQGSQFRNPPRTRFGGGSPAEPVTPKVPENPFFIDEDEEKKRRLLEGESSQPFFKAFTKRKGRPVLIAEGPLEFVERVGKRRVRETLGASLFLTGPRGNLISPKPSPIFARSKKNPLVLVQKRKYRLSSPFEVKEIQRARNRGLFFK